MPDRMHLLPRLRELRGLSGRDPYALALLVAVELSEGSPMSLSDLAREAGVSRAKAAALVSALEGSRSLRVDRRHDEHGRRLCSRYFVDDPGERFEQGVRSWLLRDRAASDA